LTRGRSGRPGSSSTTPASSTQPERREASERETGPAPPAAHGGRAMIYRGRLVIWRDRLARSRRSFPPPPLFPVAAPTPLPRRTADVRDPRSSDLHRPARLGRRAVARQVRAAGRYLQYRVELAAGPGGRRPQLAAIGFTHNGAPPRSAGESGS
jgi:hypothetical protein